MSIDRIWPSRGYVPGNIQVISHRANSMKASRSPRQLAAWDDAGLDGDHRALAAWARRCLAEHPEAARRGHRVIGLPRAA
jgi:hypothetical protein